MLKLEAGKRYVTRDGRLTDPLRSTAVASSRFPFGGTLTSTGQFFMWTDNGNFYNTKEQRELDILEEYSAPLDLSNPLSQTFDAMTKEQQDGLRALEEWGVQWKTASGEWSSVKQAAFASGHVYRQKPGPTVVQHPSAKPGIYTNEDGDQIEVKR